MLTYNPSIHYTLTRLVPGTVAHGWEFVCPTCGYQIRYTPGANPGSYRFEILHLGDTQARHFSRSIQTEPSPVHATPELDADDEAWLTPELRQQMEDLLRDVDMGDWDVET